jgi:hypothetical protein
LEKVVLLDIVDVERNINDHIWEMTPLLGLMEANRWKMAPLGMLLFLFPYEYQLLVLGRPLSSQSMISSYLTSLQKIQEEVDQPDIVVVGLIERNMHDYRTANMIEVAVHEIVEHEF